MIIKFVCPICGHNKITESATIPVYSEVVSIYNDKSYCYTENASNYELNWDTLRVKSYSCSKCNFTIEAEYPIDLFNWLKKNDMLEKE